MKCLENDSQHTNARKGGLSTCYEIKNGNSQRVQKSAPIVMYFHCTCAIGWFSNCWDIQNVIDVDLVEKLPMEYYDNFHHEIG